MDEFETRYRAALDRWFAGIRAERWTNRHDFTEKEYEPYVLAIGRLLLAWNDLHEKLASLFALALGGGFTDRPFGFWHAARADMAKRSLLKIAIETLSDSETGERPKLKKEILWILSNAQELEGQRDDAAHTPLRAALSWQGSTLTDSNPVQNLLSLASGVFAETVMGNPRAARIERDRKDLLAEFDYSRRRVILLRDYAMAIDLAWTNAQLAWPDRPKLPNPPPRSGQPRKGKRQKSEQLPRQPRPSQE